jgi:YHS domain-containing protein
MVFLVSVAFQAGPVPAAGDKEAPADKAEPGEMVRAPADKAEPAEMVEDAYPLETCVVSGAKLGSMGDPVIHDYQGRQIRFCCAGCVKPFESDPEEYLNKLDEAIIARDLPGYWLETCLVSGRPLEGKDADPVNYIHNDRLIRLYDEDAVKKFKKDPEQYLKKLDEAQMMHDMKMMEETGMMEGAKMKKAAGMEGKQTMQMETAPESSGQKHCGGH